MSEEKQDISEEESKPASQLPLPGGNFQLFVHKLSIQGMFALGLIENPITKKTERNLDHARMVIDDLLMLREKTEGNLSSEESDQLSKAISDLQWQFVRGHS